MRDEAVLADDGLYGLRFRDEPAGEVDEVNNSRTAILAVESWDDGFGGGDAAV